MLLDCCIEAQQGLRTLGSPVVTNSVDEASSHCLYLVLDTVNLAIPIPK